MIDEMNQEFSTEKTRLADRTIRRDEANYLHRSNQNQREMSKFIEKLFYNEKTLCGMRINLGFTLISPLTVNALPSWHAHPKRSAIIASNFSSISIMT